MRLTYTGGGTGDRPHDTPTLNRQPGTCPMWICAFRSLRPRSPWSLLLALLLLPTSPSAVQAASATEATTPDCAQSGIEPRPVAVQLGLVKRQVAARLHSPPSALPAAGCKVSLQFHLPEDHRPRYAVWRDVEARAVQPDGTPDPTRPDPLPLRLWIHPDGNLEYEVREAVLDILGAALGLASVLGALGARLDDSGRVSRLDWNQDTT